MNYFSAPLTLEISHWISNDGRKQKGKGKAFDLLLKKNLHLSNKVKILLSKCQKFHPLLGG